MKFLPRRWMGAGMVCSFAMLSIGCSGIFKREVVVEREKVQFAIPRDKIKKVVLQNGMTILIYKTTQVPKVLVQIAYNIGSGVEESGERGLAHLIEHMIFKGTQKLSEGDIDAIARKYGATFNAFTAKDITSYYFEVNKNNWQPFVGILADCMQNARFDDQHLASEIKTVMQELRMMKDNYFRWMFSKASELIYPSNHPYHHPIIGYKEDLLTLSGQRLKDFYHKYYHPDKAALFVVGDVNVDEAIALAKDNFESVPKGQREEDRIIPQEFGELASNVNHVYEDITKELQGLYWEIPGLKVGNDVLTTVVEGVLGHGEGSILYRRLVDQEKIATSVDVGSIQLQESGIFFVVVEPKEGEAEHCKNVIKEELQKVINDGIDTQTLTKVVRTKEREFITMLQSAQSLTYQWIQSFFSKNDELALFKKLDEYYQIDEAAVQAFIKAYLDPFFIGELNVLPLPEKKKELWLEKKKRSDQIDMAILQHYSRTSPLEEPTFVKTMPNPKKLEFSFPKPDAVVKFDNGLKVILHKKTDVPLIQIACRFKEANFYARAKEGIGLDLMMNMLMEGSRGYSKDENVAFFELHGANYAFGSTGGHFATVNVSYKPVLERFFHVITKPQFDNHALEKLKAMYVDSYQRSKDSPQAMAFRLLKTIVYKDHPYGWNFDEAIDLVKKLSIADLQAIHEKYISPHNMILTVVGDIDLATIKQDLKEVFGLWEGKPYQEPTLQNGAFEPGAQKDQVMLRDQVMLVLGQESAVDIYHPDLIPLELLNFICFHSLGSRLYELRERTGLFYVASGAWGAGATKVYGIDHLYALLSVDKLQDAELAMKDLINEIGKTGIKQYELNDARQNYLKSVIDLIVSNRAIAGTLGYLEEFGLGFDYYDKVLTRVQTMTVEELNKICAQYFVADNLARVRVGRV